MKNQNMLRRYTTLITAIDPHDGELKLYAGPHVPGINEEDARAYCDRNGLGYCKIAGLLIYEIDELGNKTNYDNLN
jgi:hypothetical protein